MRSRLLCSLALPLLLAALGCTREKGDTGETSLPVAPCADGTWDAFSDPDGALHISQHQGSSGGAGTASDPVDDIEAATDLVEAGGGFSGLAFWPGSYTGPLRMGLETSDTDTGVSSPYDGMTIQGCSSDEVQLSVDNDEDPVVVLTQVEGVDIQGLTLTGGQFALWIKGSADTTVSQLVVDESHMAGVVIDGPDMIVMREVTVQDTHATELATTGQFLGIGMVVDDAELQISDSSITGSTTIGLLVNGSTANLVADALTVSDTASTADDLLGRGIQLQGNASGTITSPTITGSHDAAIFALLPLNLSISQAVIEGVEAANVGSEAQSGDGIVVTGDDGNDGDFGAETFDVELVGNSIDNWVTDRAGIYVENVDCYLEGNAPNDTDEIMYDNRAILSGTDLEDLDLIKTTLDIARELDLTGMYEE